MPNPSHEDPEVRALVLATVTLDEARRVLRTRDGKPWCDALAEILIEGIAPTLSGGECDGRAQVASIRQR